MNLVPPPARRLIRRRAGGGPRSGTSPRPTAHTGSHAIGRLLACLFLLTTLTASTNAGVRAGVVAAPTTGPLPAPSSPAPPAARASASAPTSPSTTVASSQDPAREVLVPWLPQPTATSTTTPSTTAPTVVPAPTGTTAAPTTAAPAPPTVPALPVPVPLPQPTPPPPDPEASEPVVALGRLAIPKLGVDSPMFEGIRLPTFDMGPGHWPGSGGPGQQGNMVIGGHRTSGHADFRHIDQLVPGDQMIVTDNNGRAYTYAVTSTEIVGEYSMRALFQTPQPTATLFACDPPGSTTHRILVHFTFVG